MTSPISLPILSALALAGAAIGVHLGNSALSEIPGWYFEPAPTRFHADLAPHRGTAGTDYAAAVPEVVPLGGADFDPGCCIDYPEEYTPEPYAFESYAAEADGYGDGHDDGYSASARIPADRASAQAEIERAVAIAERSADLAAIDRYASYPIRTGEAPRARTAAMATVETDRPEEPAVALGM